MSGIVTAPRINTNDDQVGVVAWHVAEGDFIESGEALVDLETSKAVVTIDAEASGYVHILAQTGCIVKVGSSICTLSESADAPTAVSHIADPVPAPPAAPLPADAAPAARAPAAAAMAFSGTRFSQGALEAMQSLGLSRERFADAGLVTARMVCGEPAAAAARRALPPHTARPQAAMRAPLSPRAVAVPLGKRAEIASLSIGEAGLINSTLTVQFNSLPIRNRLAQAGSFDGSIQPVILYELSRLLRQWPQFTAYFDADTIHYYERVDLGIALDMGRGLKVLTIKDADLLMPIEIFERTIDFGLRYMDNTIRPDELVGSTLTVTDLSSLDVLQFVPLINGHQSAIIGLGGDSELPGHPMTINMTFDHRVSNGREAAMFLRELRARILSYAPVSPSVAVVAARTAAAPARTEVRCGRCGITYGGLVQQTGRDAEMLACFSEDGALDGLCHGCLAGFT